MLSVDDVSLSFGGFQALRAVSLVAMPASITGIIGPNGSGKSTLLNVVAGVYVPDSGAVTLNGRPLAYGRPEQVAAAGIGRTFQVPRLAHRLTVFQNMMAGERDQAGEGVFNLFLRPAAVSSREAEIAGRAEAMLKRLGLAHKANDYAGSLSGGQQKLLTMGMLLMSDPAVLLLDEPAAGVNPVLIEQQAALLHELKAEGRIVMLIEHNMEMIANVCDRVFVLDAGELIAAGTPAEIRADERVVRSYLGMPA
ncbi:ABC transporter ATP-binding protein [Ancylobacter sp. Lp-2]|uniref:ABC transporter ATP-binding protein n=1 Tax=Ancylobacter sp. Lp-2 TaxID=2881339 RepID=UPI001E656E71|nr:ABC transporter ATP-binding protein [Ancylobacter sp. Lp-2]MCB4768333.1 ABC transporter ATP-binding protein [Ancylobacter sp. Lp-2]